jgi:hypothetical protein
MANGKLILFRKDNFSSFATLDILSTFNMEDNLNETPSNMKVKAITSNSFREEFEVNTVALHEDTNTWWVVKSDESTYLMTGEYEHEIQLVELLEFYSYRHLPNCAFAPNTYTLQQMLNRLFSIGKLTSPTLTIPNPLPSFLDQNKIMPFLSFENFTVANAIKNIARAINAIPKVTATYSTSGGVFYLIGSFVLTFINRNGINNTILETLNTQFPVAYEKNMNSSDQFTTRSVSNITNAKSSALVISPKQGGFKIVTPNSSSYNKDNAVINLPSKIDKIDFIRLYLPIQLVARGGVGPVDTVLFTGYYSNKTEWESIIESLRTTLTTTYGLTNTEVNTAKTALPNPELQAQFNYDDPINRTSYGLTKTFFEDKLTIKNKFDFDTITSTEQKDRTCHWNPFTNELIMSKTFRYGLDVFGFVNFYEANQYRRLVDGAGTHDLFLKIKSRNAGFFEDRVPTEEVLIQVGYYPIADIKVSIDNDNDAQDEKFFNQSGKVIDAVSVSKLITSHTNDSVEGTKIRNARYESLANILPLGQLVRDSNQTYVITQRSIDGQVKNGNEYYNVIYTLSRNRVARSENIVADSSVISYKTPDDNLVFRSQLYKDYVELSLTNITNRDIPYLDIYKVLILSSTLAGTNFDYTILARNQFSSTTVRYVKNPTTFDLHKAKLINVNWQDNSVLGFRLDSTGSTYVQTPILYTDNLGKATNFELLFLDTTNLNQAVTDYNNPYDAGTYDPLVPFTDLTRVPTSFYTSDVVADGRFSIRIQEPNYTKDPFEIPVFEYMIQGNDDYNPLGNIVIGNDLFTTFTGNITYHYVINNGNRFTAENADRILGSSGLSGETNRRVIINRVVATQMLLKLYSNYSGSPTENTSAITNIGFYAVDWGTLKTKFLFAINDYVESGINDKNDIRVFINNWKI